MLTSDFVSIIFNFQGMSRRHQEKHPIDIVPSNQQGAVLHRASCHVILVSQACQCLDTSCIASCCEVLHGGCLRRGQIYTHHVSHVTLILLFDEIICSTTSTMLTLPISNEIGLMLPNSFNHLYISLSMQSLNKRIGHIKRSRYAFF